MFTVPAVRFKQNGRRIFSFVVDGKTIHEFARVPHLNRDAETGRLVGYQRDEVKRHIANIRDYLETGKSPIIPNAIVLAFDKGPRFVPATPDADVGMLEITESENGCADVVDGQQRLAAIRDANIETFPVACVAFISESEEMKREHFVRVNGSRPLDRRVLMELLPGIDCAITADLEKKRIPAVLIDRLNNDPDSPLRGLIKTASNPGGHIPGTTFAEGIVNSLKAGGMLYKFRKTDETSDIDGMTAAMSNYWKAVAHVFRDAWEADRADSRISYGGPVGALLGLMDATAGTLPTNKMSLAHFKRELALVAPNCHWTAESGDWDFGPDGRRPWNALDNGTKGIGFLRAFLVNVYHEAKADAAANATANAQANAYTSNGVANSAELVS